MTCIECPLLIPAFSVSAEGSSFTWRCIFVVRRRRVRLGTLRCKFVARGFVICSDLLARVLRLRYSVLAQTPTPCHRHGKRCRLCPGPDAPVKAGGPGLSTDWKPTDRLRGGPAPPRPGQGTESVPSGPAAAMDLSMRLSHRDGPGTLSSTTCQ